MIMNRPTVRAWASGHKEVRLEWPKDHEAIDRDGVYLNLDEAIMLLTQIAEEIGSASVMLPDEESLDDESLDAS